MDSIPVPPKHFSRKRVIPKHLWCKCTRKKNAGSFLYPQLRCFLRMVKATNKMSLYAGFLKDPNSLVLENNLFINLRIGQHLKFGQDSKHDNDRRNVLAELTYQPIKPVRFVKCIASIFFLQAHFNILSILKWLKQ